MHVRLSQFEYYLVLFKYFLFQPLYLSTAEGQFFVHILRIKGSTSFFDSVIESLSLIQITFLLEVDDLPPHSDCNLLELLLEYLDLLPEL